jgi:hypothetical protein
MAGAAMSYSASWVWKPHRRNERYAQLMGWMAPWRHRCAKMVVVKDHQQQEPSMGDITTIGLDLAKSVFQVHAVDEVAG